MKITSQFLITIVAAALLFSGGPAPASLPLNPDKIAAPPFHETTNWQIKPSFVYDVLCLLNVLTADSFYLNYYQKDYDVLVKQMTPQDKAAASDLKLKVKDQGGQIISAALCLYVSVTNARTLDDLLNLLTNSSEMQQRLQETPYYSDEGWQLFETVKPDLRILFKFLKTIDFPTYWQTTIKPKADKAIAKIEPQVMKYNVIKEVEQTLGHPLSSNRIEVFLLYYSQPHGIKITGTRFITHISYPIEIVVHNATHEMMHPPIDEPALFKELENTVAGDPFAMKRFNGRDPAYGYNTLEAYVDEDVVQALDQLITEQFGISRDPEKRWRGDDGGMHVLAAALYHLMKQEHFNQLGEGAQKFLHRMLDNGKLGPGKIEALYKDFYSPDRKRKD